MCVDVCGRHVSANQKKSKPKIICVIETCSNVQNLKVFMSESSAELLITTVVLIIMMQKSMLYIDLEVVR